MQKTYVVWHDNGKKGQYGFTEYTEEEMLRIFGSVESMVSDYESRGTKVYMVQ